MPEGDTTEQVRAPLEGAIPRHGLRRLGTGSSRSRRRDRPRSGPGASILPTRYGLMSGVLLFLDAARRGNYVNNPGHLLTFLLAGPQPTRSIRPGATCGSAPGLPWRAAGVQWRSGAVRGRVRRRRARTSGDPDRMPDDSEPALVDIDDGNRPTARELQLRHGIPRGLHRPGRLVISTCYPDGLLRAWCYVACDRPLLVYPKPGARWTPRGAAGDRQRCDEWGGGSDDFAGLRGYRPGDLPSQIDWKSYARERGLNTPVQWSGRDAIVARLGGRARNGCRVVGVCVGRCSTPSGWPSLRPARGLDDCAGARSGAPPPVSSTSRAATAQRCVMRRALPIAPRLLGATLFVLAA